MFQNLDVFRTAITMARHAGAQQAVSAQNIANADTPGYRGIDLPEFTEILRGRPSAMRATRAGHLNRASGAAPFDLAERRTAEDPNRNTVSLEAEMLTAVDAQRTHDRALAIYRSNLTLLRSSLGT